MAIPTLKKVFANEILEDCEHFQVADLIGARVMFRRCRQACLRAALHLLTVNAFLLPHSL